MTARAAATVARAWAWLYTLGLARELRTERRAELDSDLWEQARDAAAAGRSPAHPVHEALLTLARVLLGVPADLSWRAEHASAGGLAAAPLRLALALLHGGERLAGWVERRGLPGLTFALAGLYGLLGLAVIVTIPVNDDANVTPAQLFALGLIALAAAAALLAGARRRRRPRAGAALIVGRSGVMGLALWPTVVAPLAAVLVSYSAVRRAGGPRAFAPARLLRLARSSPSAASEPTRAGLRAGLADRKVSSYNAGTMIPKFVWMPPDLIARLAERIDDDSHGVRRAVLCGAQLGLLGAIVGRVWMRLISEQQVFSVPGTLFIVIVVSGFGALAGWAFAVRRRPRGRIRRWLFRVLALVPFLGMGPFVVFFLGNLVYAVTSGRGWRRLVRWPLLGLGALLAGFWTLVFISQNPDGTGWAAALLYLAIGYLLFVSLRFALDPAGTRARLNGDAVLEV